MGVRHRFQQCVATSFVIPAIHRRDLLTTQGNRHTGAFDAGKQRVILERLHEPASRNDVDELLEDMRRVLGRSGERKLTAEEMQKIVEVVRGLVS